MPSRRAARELEIHVHKLTIASALATLAIAPAPAAPPPMPPVPGSYHCVFFAGGPLNGQAGKVEPRIIRLFNEKRTRTVIDCDTKK